MLSSRRLKSNLNLVIISFLISGIILQGILPTTIYAASMITSDGTMGTIINQVDNIYNIDGGTIKGTNLFQSFGLLIVGAGDTASFNGPDYIINIIGRVTGGQPSVINGILCSTITGANLYLLNPYGVLFGKDASLNVSGSFHVSTADYLKLSDGGIFYSNPLRSSVLTTAAPAAFGFLSNNPAPITVQESSLQVPKNKALSLVGGDIQIDNGALLKAPHGQINIASVASPGEVIPNLPGQLPTLDVSSFAHLGHITASGSNITVSSIEGAGVVLIRGGRLVMDNAYINANNDGALAGSLLGIDVQLAEDLVLLNGAQMLTYSSGAGRAGDIRIKAESVEMLGGSFIYSGAFSTGNSGNIDVATNSLTIKNGAYIGTETYSTGNSGNITVNTSSLKVIDGWSFIFTGTYGPGNSGKIELHADEMVLSGGPAGGVIVGSFTAGDGNCGDLLVTAKNLQILNGSELSTTVYSGSSGNGGTIEVAADRVFISGSDNPNIYTGIFANTFGEGKGGTLILTANSLEMTNRASIQAGTWGTGDSGNITLRVGTLDLIDASYIASVGIFGEGLGNSGDIEVTANRVFISGLDNSTQPFSRDVTGILNEAREGHGGNVYITTDSLMLTNRGTISSSSYGSGPGGKIEINANYVELLNGSNILSSAFGSGNGGKIEVTADKVLISGVHPEPFTDITGNESLSPSGIASQAGLMGGSAGDVQITTNTLNVLDGARISTETFGPGHGGSIGVTGNNVLISGVNVALREFLIEKGIDMEEAGKLASAGILAGTNSSFLGDGATGNAGNVSIQAKNLQVSDQGLISTRTTGPGTGGNIELTSNRVTLSEGALISSESSVSANAGKAGDILINASGIFQSNNSSVTTAAEQARGGDITIKAREMQLTSGTLISAESSGAGDAGSINMIATNSLLMRNSSITTEAKEADGGNINIQSGYMVELIDSKITASVGGGPETVGGNITIDPRYVILNDSQIVANAYEGKGGNIQITADVFLASPESVVDASSALGINGTVDIRAPITNISGTLAPVQGNFLSTEALLRDRCAAKIRGEKFSSFIVSGRDGLPIRPGSVLPSPIY